MKKASKTPPLPLYKPRLMTDDMMHELKKRLSTPDAEAGSAARISTGNGKARAVKNVPDRLAALAAISRERGAVYGDDYKQVGKVLLSLFPRGISLKTADEFRRFILFAFLVTKIGRYARNMDKGHADSLEDLAVYAMMMRETDDESSDI